MWLLGLKRDFIRRPVGKERICEYESRARFEMGYGF